MERSDFSQIDWSTFTVYSWYTERKLRFEGNNELVGGRFVEMQGRFY